MATGRGRAGDRCRRPCPRLQYAQAGDGGAMTQTLTFPLSTEHQRGAAGVNYGASGIRTNSLRLDGNSLSHRSVSIITAQRIEISLEGWPM